MSFHNKGLYNKDRARYLLDTYIIIKSNCLIRSDNLPSIILLKPNK